MEIWEIDTLEDGRIELTAPNGIVLFRVSSDTALMLAEMLIDEVEVDDDDDLDN